AGKFRAITWKLSSWSAISSTSSPASSHTPRPPSRALSAWECSRHRRSGTIRSSLLLTLSRVASAGSRCQVSSSTWPFLMIRCIDALLERVDPDTAEGVEEGFFFGALFDVDLDQLVDHVGPLLLGEGLAEDLRQAGLAAGAAAARDLVALPARLAGAAVADVAHVVVAAGVHAAGDVEVDVSDVEQVVEVVEAALDGLGHRERLGIGQGAEVAARAADDVGQQADVRR